MPMAITVKPVYNDYPRDSKIVAVVDRWSFFRGRLCNKRYKMVATIWRWSVVSSGSTVFQKTKKCDKGGVKRRT
jgi:hypothetical protein